MTTPEVSSISKFPRTMVRPAPAPRMVMAWPTKTLGARCSPAAIETTSPFRADRTASPIEAYSRRSDGNGKW